MPEKLPSEVVRFEEAPFRFIEIMGEKVHVVTGKDVIKYILSKLAERRGGSVVTHNLDHLRRLKADPSFAALCAEASIRTADGAPLVWAAKIRGTPLPGRVAGSDLTPALCEAAATAGRSIYFLGGNEGTADELAEKLRAKLPGLVVAGTCCPPVGFEKDAGVLESVISGVVACKPDIVFVALGSPKQERLADLLIRQHPRAWYLGVGVSLSFMTGEIKRAPRWMQVMGLEWLHRMVQEPRRLVHRYLVVGVPFGVKLLGGAIVERLTRKDQ